MKIEIKLKKIDLVFNEKDHSYMLNGIYVPGVTTAIGVLPKPALVPWAAKLTSEAIGKLIDPDKPYTRTEIDELCKKGKMAWREKKESSADKGTEAHKFLESYVKTAFQEDVVTFPLPTDPDVKNSIEKFMQWEKEHTVEWMMSEVRIASEEHQFAGTLDALAVVDGRLTLIDFKTSAGIYESFYIQTAGYQICLEELGCIPDQRMILWIPKEGKKFEGHIVSTTYGQDKQAFLTALAMYRVLQGYKK